jgi:hypothetical protein
MPGGIPGNIVNTLMQRPGFTRKDTFEREDYGLSQGYAFLLGKLLRQALRSLISNMQGHRSFDPKHVHRLSIAVV